MEPCNYNKCNEYKLSTLNNRHIVSCKYFKINDKVRDKGEQKLKINMNSSVQHYIGTCYIMLPKFVHDEKTYIKNKLRWAVKHLQHENSTIKDIAKMIVNGKIKV